MDDAWVTRGEDGPDGSVRTQNEPHPDGVSRQYQLWLGRGSAKIKHTSYVLILRL